MLIQDLVNLIQIRNYVSMAVNNSAIDKKMAHSLNSMQILLDKTIIEHLTSVDFKNVIGFDGVEDAVREAAKNNNIRTGMKISAGPVPAVAATSGHPTYLKPEPV